MDLFKKNFFIINLFRKYCEVQFFATGENRNFANIFFSL